MEERYGIPASVEFVIGHGEHDEREGIYGVQDKINGRSPLDASFTAERELALREMTALYDKLIHYYEDKHAEGDFYLRDIARNEQFLYGTAPGETELRMHLVDVDILLGKAPYGLAQPLIALAKSLWVMEQKLDTVFTDQRAALERLVERIQAEHPSPANASVLEYLHR